ncbi:MAG: glycosyltransferase family 39 protein [Gammaproteobacteria bacterium]|nr:glycosyltransferase family 39 protein [Gammaproteobacteria bacterium]
MSTTPALNLPQLRILLLSIILVSFYFNIHAIPLFDLDEGAFSEATREMLITGDFISTYLDGKPRYDKPILIYWLQAASVSLFGVNEFAFRLPSALAATLWTLATFLFMRHVRDERTGLAASIITASAFEVSVMGSAATADALLNLFIAGSMFTVFLYWREGRRRWLWLSFVLIGLGFLTKGPVAVLIPLVVSFLFYAIKRDLSNWLRLVFNPLGITLFLLIAAPWYVAQYLKEGEAFIEGFFLKHNLDRFQSPMEKHGGSLFYYVPVVLIAVLPYTSLLLKSLSGFRSQLRDDLSLFSLLWFGFVIVFFSLSGTKLPHYVLYGLTGLFLIMAMNLSAPRSSFWLFLPVILWFGLLLVLPDVLARLPSSIEDPFARAMITDADGRFSLAYRLFFLGAIAIVLFMMFERKFTISDKLLSTGLLSVLGLSMFLLPIVGEVKQGPIKEAAAIANREGYELVRWKLNTPSFSVYTQKVTQSRRPKQGEIVLTKINYLPDLPDHEILYQRGGVVMARLSP